MTDPYWVFRDTGLGVDIASIRGGEPPIDPRSMSGSRGSGPLVRRFQADAKAMEAFRSTPELGSVDASSYDALFLAGGHGTMWDFPSSLPLNRTLTRAFRANRVVAAVCHGPAGLLGITDARGEPVIKGRRVTGFTNAEEQAVQLTSVVPFLLEDAMKAKGARFVAGPDFEPHVLQDRYLITGQNPRSAEPAAQLVVQALSRCSALQAPVR
jgi:putative intracellular protease/amidase